MPFSKNMPLLANRVAPIVVVCSEEKMVWTTTLRSVAMVTDKQSLWNITEMQLP